MITQSTGLEPLVVSPTQARQLLDCGQARLYELINSGEIESFKDGKSRKITLESIKARVARMLAAAGEGAAK